MTARDGRSDAAGTFKLAIVGALGLVLVLRPSGMACVPLQCGMDGWHFGVPLFMAAICTGVVGQAFLLLTASFRTAHSVPGFFTPLATGLVVLVTYVFIRSLLNHLVAWELPITRAEILCLVALAALILLLRREPGSPHRLLQLPWLDMTLMLMICIVVADRELPREIMLSSDPDMHVFFGWQVDRFGGVPFNQGDWGPEGFNYPAGSGVVLFLWKSLSGMLPRQLLVVLPVLFMFAAMLLVAERAGARLTHEWHRLLLKLSAIAATVAGFMFPLYMQYAHLEGAARQLSVLPAALFVAFTMEAAREVQRPSGRWMLIPVMTIFVLGTLNPANVVIPGLLLFALWIRAVVNHGRSWPLLVVFVAGLALLLILAPYYHGLAGIVERARVDTVTYDERLIIKTLPEILSAVWATWSGEFPVLVREASVLFSEQGRPVFLILLTVFLASTWLLHRRRVWPAAGEWWALAAFLMALYLSYGIARSLLDDRRFFLLGPYVFFSMTQYKAMLIVLLLTAILERLVRVRWIGTGLALVAAGAMVFGIMYLVRAEQAMYLAPRKDYCGVYGCLEEDDRRLLASFEDQVAQGRFTEADGSLPKVLLPNAFKNTEHESWILPVSSARVLPFYEVLPAAFYYFQGDLEYSTASYKAHVCDFFDREWLAERRIRYVYLPSRRQEACVAGIDNLPATDEVILRQGQAFLIRLR